MVNVEKDGGGKAQLLGNTPNLLYQSLVADGTTTEDPQARVGDAISRLAARPVGRPTATHLVGYHILGLSTRNEGIPLSLIVRNDPVRPVEEFGQPAGSDGQLAGHIVIVDVGTQATTGPIAFGVLGVVEYVNGVSPEAGLGFE